MISNKWKNIFTTILSDKTNNNISNTPNIKNNIILFNILDLIKYNSKLDIITIPIYNINNYLYFSLELLKYIQINNFNNYLFDSSIINLHKEYNSQLLHFFEHGYLITYIPLNIHFYNYINLINIHDKLNYIALHFHNNRTEIYNLYNSIDVYIIHKEDLDNKINKLEKKILILENELYKLKKNN